MATREIVSLPDEIIEQKIYLIRGHKVMVDSDLAILYGVSSKRLNEQVKRNIARFPKDFMFQLTKEEDIDLRSHFATSKKIRGGRRYLSYVFTQEGVAMLSGVLTSTRAVEVNILIMRTFVKLRQLLATHTDLLRRLDKIEEGYDAQFRIVFDAIRKLMAPEPVPEKQRIGFRVD